MDMHRLGLPSPRRAQRSAGPSRSGAMAGEETRQPAKRCRGGGVFPLFGDEAMRHRAAFLSERIDELIHRPGRVERLVHFIHVDPIFAAEEERGRVLTGDMEDVVVARLVVLRQERRALAVVADRQPSVDLRSHRLHPLRGLHPSASLSLGTRRGLPIVPGVHERSPCTVAATI